MFVLATSVGAVPLDLGVRVLDLNSDGVEKSSYPSRGVYWKGLYLFAGDQDDGAELFVSDGTEPGTFELADLRPGPTGSSPADFVRVGPSEDPTSRVFFTADLGLSGRELWVTDGTVEGTEVVVDADPTSGSDPSSLTSWDGDLYFIAETAGAEIALHRADAATLAVTALGAGTVDLAAGTELEPSNGVLYFASEPPMPQIWATTGSPPFPVTTLSCDAIGDLLGVGGELFFVCETGLGNYLYKVDGGAPAGAVDVHVEPAGTSIAQLTASGGYLYFVRDEEDLVAYEDGGGTVTVVHNNSTRTFPLSLTPYQGSLLYTVDTPAEGREPWLATGTTTSIIADLRTGGADSMFSTAEFEIRSGVAFFGADDGTGDGRELWRTDGTGANTTMVRDADPGPGGAIFHPTATPLGVFFQGGSPRHLWLTDGTEMGTVQVGNFPSFSSSPSWFVGDSLGQRVFFRPEDHPLGSEPSVSDGTEAGTGIILDMAPPEETTASATFLASLPAPSGSLAPSLALFSFYLAGESQFWATDGTEVGTELLAIPNPGGSVNFFGASSHPFGALLGDVFVFPMDDRAGSGYELWVSDGTAAGTHQLLELLPGAEDGVTSAAYAHFGDHFYFVGDDGSTGSELWRTDGTVAGTEPVVDLEPGVADSSLSHLVASSTHLYFFDGDDTLWVSDGTEMGTTSLGTVQGWDPVPDDSGIWFVGSDETFFAEVWHATPGGALRVTDLLPDSGDVEPELVGVVGGRVVFWADDGTGDGLARLWSTSTAGDVSLVGMFTDYGPVWPSVVWNGWLYFLAETAATGDDLWRTDGVVVEPVDLAPGPASSDPDWLTPAGDRFFLSAWDQGVKQELFVLETALFSDGFESGDTSGWD